MGRPMVRNRLHESVVVAATPVNLAALVRVTRPIVRARYEYANGRPASVFGATLGRARDIAVAQEAKALVKRVDALAAEWGVSPPA